jgi:hypothetical protein
MEPGKSLSPNNTSLTSPTWQSQNKQDQNHFLNFKKTFDK